LVTVQDIIEFYKSSFLIYLNCVAILFDSGGNPKGVFGLAPVQGEWKVFVKRPLDREEQDQYLLNITASDGLFVTRIGVEVTVIDANDNSPICNQV